ncbi:Glycerol-3-phosphate dehydrogenase (D(P)(+)) [Brachyspira intermedia PWS/A]|uniref:Glycerol-3-phosphate dehydrogenase [NAD(P)+] n=1 Tax=Brachyspira intermedia (strain ATCC 51140 / PWS/A) TaxID=1045858 RepID=G0EQL8_BRAIP|nr:NAD(P)H-dependent glycerol-3-phosphate dehydrogenase [Brachyspira intermedia]AEM22119.1 Glycerol-3-phosphate dehydrogenase (D(P)(+)) [Brachyspira intermedia PWS/A]
MISVGIIGAGGWGLALANIFSEKHNVKVWVHSEDSYKLLSTSYRNDNYLENIELNKNIQFTMDIGDAVNDSEIVIIVTPSFAFAEACTNIEPYISNDQILVSATKGLDRKTGKTMSEVARSIISGDLSILTLSGPSHAEEAAKGVPTAVVVGGEKGVSEYVRDTLTVPPKFRIYNSTDQKGVEIGGALKNIIAIAGGIVDGLKLGDNTKAALITRGLHEIVRFALSKGARIDTMYGLSGIGDLIVTCSSGLSRNNRLGRELAKGKKYQDVIAESHGQVAEGVYATTAAYEYAQKNIYICQSQKPYIIYFSIMRIYRIL